MTLLRAPREWIFFNYYCAADVCFLISCICFRSMSSRSSSVFDNLRKCLLGIRAINRVRLSTKLFCIESG